MDYTLDYDTKLFCLFYGFDKIIHLYFPCILCSLSKLNAVVCVVCISPIAYRVNQIKVPKETKSSAGEQDIS